MLAAAAANGQTVNEICGSHILYQQLSHQSFGNITQKKTNSYSPSSINAIYHPIPLIFHIVLTSKQIMMLGGEDGIKKRLDSQIEVLNNDFNGLNNDSTNIPSLFRPLQGRSEIHFALAHTNPNGTYTSGFEITLAENTGFEFKNAYGSGLAFSGVKYHVDGGADAWDITSYLNIWVINTIENGRNSNILGLAIPPAYVSNIGIPPVEQGIVVDYSVLGVQSRPDEYFAPHYSRGRTLTHEMGHMLGLAHVWGDDTGLCENNGGVDDGINDTPPQADMTEGCPTFPHYDNCTVSGAGIMFVNFMDYSYDDCRLMFTKQQAELMHSFILPGEAMYSLTQHPDLLIEHKESNGIVVLVNPNPVLNSLSIIFNTLPTDLIYIAISNSLGQQIWFTKIDNPAAFYSYNFSRDNPGIYFLQLVFRNQKKQFYKIQHL